MNGEACFGPDLASVGLIKDSSGKHNNRCSAVRIACGVFLSAAHCGPPNTTQNGQYKTWFVDMLGERTLLYESEEIPNAYWVPDNSPISLASKTRDALLYFGAESGCM